MSLTNVNKYLWGQNNQKYQNGLKFVTEQICINVNYLKNHLCLSKQPQIQMLLYLLPFFAITN